MQLLKLAEDYSGSDSSLLEQILKEAKDKTKNVFFYLKYAKYLFKSQNDLQESRKVIEEGIKEKEGKSEELILAIQKIDRQMRNYKVAE